MEPNFQPNTNHNMGEPEPLNPQPIHTTDHFSSTQPSFQSHSQTVTSFNPQPANPTSESTPTSLTELANNQPTPVVKVLSVRGVEYFMMTIALWISASGLLWAILGLINGASSFSVMVFPVSFLLVCLPLFSFFYLRLRRAELNNPELRFDPSKRRLSQITQILAFIACLTNTIAFVYSIMSKISGDSKASLVKSFLNLLVVYLVAGGILVYYWFDEHREFNKGL
jgi:hypothetical protein